jgi:deoxyribonuclease-4
MPIGAHVSTAGGLSTAMVRAQDIGVECIQLFLSSPQRWQGPRHTDEQVAEFCRLVELTGIGPNFAHACYLINLAANDPALRQRSIDNLVQSVAWADRVGLAGLVIHVGSGRGQTLDEAEANVVGALGEVLRAGGTCALVLENSAGSGELLGSRFTQLGGIVDRLDGHPRLGLCLDTAHTFASGYDLRRADGIAGALDEVAGSIGLDRLRLIHANDSKVGLNSFVDRHANIGQGELGEAPFAMLLAAAALREVPFVLEVPGYEEKGPDARSVADLKRLAGRV